MSLLGQSDSDASSSSWESGVGESGIDLVRFIERENPMAMPFDKFEGPSYVFSARRVADLCQVCQKIFSSASKFSATEPKATASQHSRLLFDESNVDVADLNLIESLNGRVDQTQAQDNDARIVGIEEYDKAIKDSSEDSSEGSQEDSGTDEDSKNSFEMSHHEDVITLNESAAVGCALCAAFTRAIGDDISGENVFQKLAQRKNEGVALSRGILKVQKYKYSLNLSLAFGAPEAEIGIHSIELEATWDENMIPNKTCLSHIESTTTKDGLDLLNQWLDKCCSQHELCTRMSLDSKPTRLIYVGSKIPRLCSTNDDPKYQRYTTLSHCWGAGKFSTLTKHNISEFHLEVPSDALSKTFNDAIEITRRLGINYIWIDSLCIIQDDADDWRNEASLMSSVYRGSTINIAATGSDDGNGGCFWKRPATWNCRLMVDKYPEDCLYISPLWWTEFENLPLFRRAWVVQERLLSPRTVHFTRTQLYWECHQNNACEVFPSRFPSDYRFANFFLEKEPLQASMWKSTIELYSKCDLTFISDKLVALSGIARAFQQETEDTYHAGLWRKSFEKLLCWRTSDGSSRYSSYTAPSWSWASINGQISSPGYKLHHGAYLYVEVLSVDITLAGPDPFGAVLHGSLRLKCDRKLRALSSEEVKQIISENLETRFNRPTHGYFLDDESKVYNAPLYLVLIREPKYSGTEGLILQSTEKKQGQYQRVGMFQSEDSLKNVADGPDRDSDDWIYQTVSRDKEGNVERIIEII